MFNTLVVDVPRDFERLQRHYKRLAVNLPGKLSFVGNRELGALVSRWCETEGDLISWIDEDSIIPFDEVHSCMEERLKTLLKGQELPRGITGWYYQQFLKMQYARGCADDYYLVWDGDTIPCRRIEMFQERSGKPYFDLKAELHEGYFETLSRLFPGMRKVIAKSFISEHMLFKTDIMNEMLDEMEKNKELQGDVFWKKIINAIPIERIQESDFSEFETYGTYTAIRHMESYALREWHSFRLAGAFFDPETISERDFNWLGKDFDAISFEKGHYVREDHKNLFDNPRYQEKLSARQMLESVQDLFNGGYVEVWGESNGLYNKT